MPLSAPCEAVGCLATARGQPPSQFGQRIVVERNFFRSQVLMEVSDGAGTGDEQHVGGKLEQPLRFPIHVTARGFSIQRVCARPRSTAHRVLRREPCG